MKQAHSETIWWKVHVICCSGNVAGAGSGVSSKMGVTSPVDEVDYDESAVTAIMGLFNVGIEEAVKIYTYTWPVIFSE